MSFLSKSSPAEVQEIANKAKSIAEQASKQTKESISWHQKQADIYARDKLVSQSIFIRK